jgi:hypothetical protein
MKLTRAQTAALHAVHQSKVAYHHSPNGIKLHAPKGIGHVPVVAIIDFGLAVVGEPYRGIVAPVTLTALGKAHVL